jgi:hypothetical protein
MEIPHDVNADSIEPHSLDHFESMFPVLMRDSGKVNFGGKDFLRDCIWFAGEVNALKFGFSNKVGQTLYLHEYETKESYQDKFGFHRNND